MNHSHLNSLLNTITNAGFTAGDTAVDALIYLLLLNSRAFALLLLCLFILQLIKGSAAKRHFFITVSVVAIALLPLTSRLTPAFDITLETSYLGGIEAEIKAPDHTAIAGGQEANLFTPDLFYLGCLAIYFLGFVVIVAKVLLSNLKIFLLTGICRPVAQKNWLDGIEKHRKNFGINRRIELRHSGFNASPSTWGVLHPVVLLPSSALQWPSHLIESTILHELAHIKRYDWLVQQAVRCIHAFYWLNPLCRIAVNKIFTYAETACDNLAINAGVSNFNYAESLVDVAGQSLQHRSCRFATLAMASHEKHSELSDRVLTILNQHECRTPITITQILTTLTVFLCVLLPLTSVRANFVEHTVEPAEPAPFEEELEKLSYNPGDYISAIPVDILPREVSIEKIESDKQVEPVSPGKKLAELKQILDTDSTPPGVNAMETPRQHPKIASANSSEILKKQIKKTLSNISQTLVDPQPADSPPNEHKSIVVHHSPIHMVIPEYPFRARTRGIEGKVTVEYSINEDGKVVEAEIVSAEPATIFNRHVLKAIKNSTFNPRKVDGKPVPAKGLVEKYVFVLET